MIRQPTCPVCEGELPPEVNGDSPHFPFCSVRCKQVDLYRWISGGYALTEQISPEQLAAEMLQDEPPPED